MFGSGIFWDKSPLWFLKILKLPSFYLGQLQIFKNALGQFIPNFLPNMWLLVLLDTLILPPVLKNNTKIYINNNKNSYNPGQNIW